MNKKLLPALLIAFALPAEGAPSLIDAFSESRRTMRPVEASPDEWTTRNDNHGLVARFSPVGLTLSVRAAGREGHVESIWRTTRVGFGRAAALLAPGKTAVDPDKPTRIEIRRNEVTEWFLNTEEGLEHGYTLSGRPSGSAKGLPLLIEIEIEGDLVAGVTDGGRHVVLRDLVGEEILRYDKLKVWDSTGRELPASLSGGGRELAFEIDEAEAVYPITIDPVFSQQAFVKSSNSDPGDRFGEAVAISGNIAVVGSPGEDGSSGGVNNPKNNDGSGRGAVYVFTRTGSTWTETAYLKAGNPPAVSLINHHFGESVAISGNTLVVGASGEESSATFVNGDSTNQDFVAAGAAYVFVLSNGIWTQQAYLKASNTSNGDGFGTKVAVSGDVVVVGTPGEAGSSTTVDGPDSNDAPQAGAAYVYERNGTAWTFSAYLKAPNAESLDSFGRSVAVSGTTIVVGATQEGGSANTVNGSFNNDAPNAGAAYVFEKVSGYWTYQAYLKPFNTDPNDFFGSSVAIQGDTIMVGATDELGNSTGVDGPDNDLGTFAGAVYEFTRSAGVWSQGAYIKPDYIGPWMSFGTAVAIDGDRMIVSAKAEISDSTGVDGNPADVDAFNSGAAYLFERNAGTWSQIHYLKASNTSLQNEFGQSVAISGGTAIVGTGLDDSDSQGINGAQSQNANVNYNSGSAYIFHLPRVAALSLSTPKTFGRTKVGKTSRPQNLNLSNLGEETITNLALQISPAGRSEFIISTLKTQSLVGQASTTLEVRFRPRRIGMRRASLTIQSSLAPKTVTLSGRGR